MKQGIKEIIGKTITSIIAVENQEPSYHNQVFLIFSDNTSFEFYGTGITCASGIDKYGIDGVNKRIERTDGKIKYQYP